MLNLRGIKSEKAKGLIDYNFQLEEKLRNQISALNAITRDFNDYGSALCCLPPSDGKTDVAVKKCFDEGLKVAFLVHKEKIGDQACEKFKMRTDNKEIKCFYIGGDSLSKKNKELAEDADVVAFSIQTVMNILETKKFII